MSHFLSTAADLDEPRVFPWIAEGIAFGADYNPEQWPEEVWAEDMALMRRAGITNVNLAIFSWVLIEPADGVFEWAWLDRLMDLLHENGIGVNLATPTAAPPMWLLRAHPEIGTVDEWGHRTGPGGRLGWAPSSKTFRRYALRVVEQIALRYRSHPALRLWHVSNELGNENGNSYGTETAAAWRAWLEARYGSVEGVNAAWGSDFWGHRFGDLAEIEPPRAARTRHSPGLSLDWMRFTSDSLLEHYIAEREVLRRLSPETPITTNFMILDEDGAAEYSRWADEVDVVANDHYTLSLDPFRHRELEFSADRSRGMAEGRPWLLMEHSAGAVNWQPVNRQKNPGEMIRDTLAHVARGADGAMFFQWRASTAGSEQWHSGMLPHAGADSRQFREVERLGAIIGALGRVQGSVVPRAEIGMLVDEQSAWAMASTRVPTTRLKHLDLAMSLHRALGDAALPVDVVPSRQSFDGRSVVVVPTLYVIDDDTAARLTRFVAEGGHLVVGFASGIADETNRIRPGGYPAVLREVLGIRVDEIRPLLPGEERRLDPSGTADIWTELVELTGAEALSTYVDGPLAGEPAITRNRFGKGTATYVSCRADDETLAAVIADVARLAEVAPVARVEGPARVTRRVSETGESFLFVIAAEEGDATVEVAGVDLVTGRATDGTLVVPAGTVAIIEESA